MVSKNSRDFISGYVQKDNQIIVSLGTGEKIVYPIEERNRIKLAIDKEIADLQSLKENAMQKSKHKKYESYVNGAIIFGSLLTLGSVEPTILPLVSLSSVAGANGVMYVVNKKKSKQYEETAKDESINNLIYELQTNLKETKDVSEKEKDVEQTPKKEAEIVQLFNDNSYEETQLRKAA